MGSTKIPAEPDSQQSNNVKNFEELYNCFIPSEPRNYKKVRIKQVKHHALEEALFDWVINQQGRRINISWETFRSKARRIQFQVIERLKEAEKSTLKVSDGWLNNFKSRWGLRILRSHGESGDADMTVVFRDLPQIKKYWKITRQVTFLMQTSADFFKMAPDKTVGTERLPGSKKEKDRISLLFCCKADASENTR